MLIITVKMAVKHSLRDAISVLFCPGVFDLSCNFLTG